MGEIFGESTNAVLMVVTVVSLIMAVSAMVFAWVKLRDTDLTTAMGKAGSVLDIAATMTAVLRTVFPTSVVANVTDKIIEYARVAVERSEQLYLTNSIGKDQRKAEAIVFVCEALELAGVERNVITDSVIDGAIEAAVLNLKNNTKHPHSDGSEGHGNVGSYNAY